MIKGEIKYKRKRLTVEQKALKTAITKVSKEVKDEVRREMPRVSGALYYSITNRVKSDRNSNAYAVIGSRVRYSKLVKGKEKIPNLYIKKVEGKYGIMASKTGSTMLKRIKESVAAEKENLLKE